VFLPIVVDKLMDLILLFASVEITTISHVVVGVAEEEVGRVDAVVIESSKRVKSVILLEAIVMPKVHSVVQAVNSDHLLLQEKILLPNSG
jgi:hypothetical protein